MKIKIIDIQAPSGRWLGAIGLRKIKDKREREFRSIVSQRIDNHIVFLTGTGATLTEALNDAQRQFAEYEDSKKTA